MVQLAQVSSSGFLQNWKIQISAFEADSYLVVKMETHLKKQFSTKSMQVTWWTTGPGHPQAS